MNGPQSPSKKSRQAEDYIALGRLLSKKRSEQLAEAVNHIVASDLSLRDKISAINEIDTGAKLGLDNEPEGAAEPGQISKPLRYRLSELLLILKKPYSRVPYLSYLLGDYRRILAFGRSTGIFDPVFFLPDVKVNQILSEFLSHTLKPWAAELSEFLDLALEDSWHYLRKIEYNLLVVLKQLCDKILSASFTFFDYRDKNLLNKVKSLEVLFLVFHYRKHYRELLQASLEQITKKDMRLSDRYEDTKELVSRILDQSSGPPSLYNFLLGLNMLKYRRFFSIDSIICTDIGELINTVQFACTPEIKEKISSLIIEGRKRLVALREEQEKIKKLDAFVETDDSGETSFAALETFYDQECSAIKGHSFASDKVDVMRLLPRFLAIVDQIFSPLLNGQVQIEKVDSVSLFSNDFFQLDFLRIRRVAERIRGLASTLESFPLEKFRNLQHSSKGITNVEAEIMKQVNGGMDITDEIAEKLEFILAGGPKNEKEAAAALDPSILRGKRFAIPYANKRLLSKSNLNGKSVVEALSYTVSILYTMAAFLHYRPVYLLLEQRQQVDRDLRSEMEILIRLAGPRLSEELQVGS